MLSLGRSSSRIVGVRSCAIQPYGTHPESRTTQNREWVEYFGRRGNHPRASALHGRTSPPADRREAVVSLTWVAPAGHSGS